MARAKLYAQPRRKVRMVQQANHDSLPKNRSTGKLEEGTWKRAGDLHPGDRLLFATGAFRHGYPIAAVARRGARVTVIGTAPEPTPFNDLKQGPAPHWEFDCMARVQIVPKGHVSNCE